jgi:hypothetical protein
MGRKLFRTQILKGSETEHAPWSARARRRLLVTAAVFAGLMAWRTTMLTINKRRGGRSKP